MGENLNGAARMLGRKSPVVTRGKYHRFVPNLTRTDGKVLLEAGKIARYIVSQEENFVII